MDVIAQCQRCGRGYLTLPIKGKDQYFHPKLPARLGKKRKVCNGWVRELAYPVPAQDFVNYGPTLPTKSP